MAPTLLQYRNMNSNPNDIETVELDEPRRINEISELSIGDKIVFERRNLTDEDIESKRPLRVVDGASKTVRSTHSDSLTGAEPYETRLFAIEARGEWEGARTYCFADAYNTFDGELAGIVDHDSGIMVEIGLVATADPADEDDAASIEFKTGRELACDGGQVQTETTTEHHIPEDDAVIMSNPTSLRGQVDMRQCPRCEREIHALDMESDPRWGEVCDGCHAELVDEHGPVSETSFAEEQEHGRPMTDGGRDLSETTRECVRCDSDAVPGSRRCSEHSRLMTDGGRDEGDIRVGDVCLDLSQGRPVQVVEALSQNAAEWSNNNGYDLLGNYANDRLEAEPEDAVFECVYVGSIQSEPSKTYAFPNSRLVRIEVEAGDDGKRVDERIAVDVLESLFDAALRSGSDETKSVLRNLAQDAFGRDMTSEARELAEVNLKMEREVEDWVDSQEDEMAEAAFEAHKEDHR